MSIAFEITPEDISSAISPTLNSELSEYILEKLDPNEIEKAALNGDEIEEQTNYAYDNIREQFTRKLETPIYFDVSVLRTTFTAHSIEEAVKTKINGGMEVTEYIHEKLRSAYDAGHDPRDYKK